MDWGLVVLGALFVALIVSDHALSAFFRRRHAARIAQMYAKHDAEIAAIYAKHDALREVARAADRISRLRF